MDGNGLDTLTSTENGRVRVHDEGGRGAECLFNDQNIALSKACAHMYLGILVPAIFVFEAHLVTKSRFLRCGGRRETRSLVQ